MESPEYIFRHIHDHRLLLAQSLSTVPVDQSFLRHQEVPMTSDIIQVGEAGNRTKPVEHIYKLSTPTLIQVCLV